MTLASRRAVLVLACLVAFLNACGSSSPAGREPAPPSSSAPPAGAPAPPAAAPAPTPASTPARPRIVVLGDSLTAGLGIAQEDAYPALLQQRLDKEHLNYEVVNAGVSGDTSAGGLSRLDWALDGDVKVLIVALGGNDGLRGLPPEELRRNLSAIIERAQARRIKV